MVNNPVGDVVVGTNAYSYPGVPPLALTATCAPMLQFALVLLTSVRLTAAFGEPIVMVFEISSQNGVSVAITST